VYLFLGGVVKLLEKSSHKQQSLIPSAKKEHLNAVGQGNFRHSGAEGRPPNIGTANRGKL
jgi:hypothetical protein